MGNVGFISATMTEDEIYNCNYLLHVLSVHVGLVGHGSGGVRGRYGRDRLYRRFLPDHGVEAVEGVRGVIDDSARAIGFHEGEAAVHEVPVPGLLVLLVVPGEAVLDVVAVAVLRMWVVVGVHLFGQWRSVREHGGGACRVAEQVMLRKDRCGVGCVRQWRPHWDEARVRCRQEAGEEDELDLCNQMWCKKENLSSVIGLKNYSKEVR